MQRGGSTYICMAPGKESNTRRKIERIHEHQASSRTPNSVCIHHYHERHNRSNNRPKYLHIFKYTVSTAVGSRRHSRFNQISHPFRILFVLPSFETLTTYCITTGINGICSYHPIFSLTSEICALLSYNQFTATCIAIETPSGHIHSTK